MGRELRERPRGRIVEKISVGAQSLARERRRFSQWPSFAQFKLLIPAGALEPGARPTLRNDGGAKAFDD
jgi:hypothetical protein